MYICVSVSVKFGPQLVPWTVVELAEDSSFDAMFLKIQAGAFDIIPVSDNLRKSILVQALAGSTKESLNVVSTTASVLGVCGIFGATVKFVVEVEENDDTGSSSSLQQLPNAFSVLLQAQRVLQRGINGLPNKKEERTKKDKLYNDIIDLLAENKLRWTDPTSHGAAFVKKLCDVLWYIDGHHNTLSERGVKVPTLFHRFKGYNMPECSKHRKRSIQNLSQAELRSGALSLQDSLQSSWFQKPSFTELRVAVEELVKCLTDYVGFLETKNKYQKLHHASLQPSSSVSDSVSTIYLNPLATDVPSSVKPLDSYLRGKNPYEAVFLRDFAPSDRRQRYTYMQELRKGLGSPAVLLTYSVGSSVGNYHFIWRVPDAFNIEAAVAENDKVIQSVRDLLPQYHTRAMRQDFVNMYGRLTSSARPYVLRDIYTELTGDRSASRTTEEAEIDQRIREALDVEDPDIIIDLRELNAGQSDKYKVFWRSCEAYLAECTAVHERRHGTATFMAKAISVRDLISEVAKQCPEGTPIPSESWVRFNFCPRNPRAKVAQHYRGRLGAKNVVQKRLFRKTHQDEHYAAALFRYEREFALKYRSECIFFCIDDKHRVKVGEPGFPVAAAERGRQVIVSLSETLVAGDHDFTKFSLIPSVVLNVTIPEKLEESWYNGQVYISLKDAVFEASSPIRHAAEMHSILVKERGNKSILLIYSDGGPDHRLTYISVQLSLIALFLNLDLDMLIACRTAPNHSWRNPVERIMSVVNLGLQCIAIMRQKGSEDFEKAIASCNNLKKIRESGVSAAAVASTLASPIELLHDLFKRLQLKDKAFKLYDAASDDEIQSFWEILLQIESNLQLTDTTKTAIADKADLLAYMKHCCKIQHYSFQIKKCRVENCTMCKPIRMQPEVFANLHFLPDPVPEGDGHYKAFADLYGTPTTEKYRPSLLEAQKQKVHKRTLDFYTSQQHVTNVGIVIQCEECEMWRLLFSRKKFNAHQRANLQTILDHVAYTCGKNIFEDLELPSGLTGVCLKEHQCYDPIEKLYYTCPDFEAICIYCATTELPDPLPTDHYPQCCNCIGSNKPKICKRSAKR